MRTGCTAAAILLSVIAAVNLLQRYLLAPRGYFLQTRAAFEEQLNDVSILFSGPSDMASNIAPEEFSEHVFNFSPRGENPIEECIRNQYYLEQMPALRALVVSVPLSKFSSHWYEHVAPRRYRPYRSYLFDYATPQDVEELTQRLGSVVWKERLGRYNPLAIFHPRNFLRFLINMKQWILSRGALRADVRNGWSPRESRRIAEEKWYRRVGWEFEGETIFDPVFLEYFRKLLVFCSEREVKVITLTHPVTEEYLSQVGGYVTRGEIESRVLRHPDFAPLIFHDLNYLHLYRENPEVFADAVHLNLEGARQFSRKVDADLREILGTAPDDGGEKTP